MTPPSYQVPAPSSDPLSKWDEQRQREFDMLARKRATGVVTPHENRRFEELQAFRRQCIQSSQDFTDPLKEECERLINYIQGIVPTGTEARVCELIARRQQMGRIKYGTTVAENPLTLREWLNHALCECLDQAVYLQRAIEEIEKREPPRLGDMKTSEFCRQKFIKTRRSCLCLIPCVVMAAWCLIFNRYPAITWLCGLILVCYTAMWLITWRLYVRSEWARLREAELELWRSECEEAMSVYEAKASGEK